MRVGLRAFTTFTSQSWLNEVGKVRLKMDDLGVRVFKREMSKPELDNRFLEIGIQINDLKNANFQGTPPIYRNEILDELRAEADKIREEGNRVIHDPRLWF